LLPLFCDMVGSFLRASAFSYRASAKLCLFYSAFTIRGTPEGQLPAASCQLSVKPSTAEGLPAPLQGRHRGAQAKFVRSAFHVFGKHSFGVDGDEDAAAAGQDLILFVEDFGYVNMAASPDLELASLDAQRLMQGYWLEVLDRHFAGEGDDVTQLIYLAHGVVEDAGDDAAVAVAGRSAVALAEAEAADEGLAFFVEGEF
jgi:hypothetical protein